jgi:hypothetical protein
MSKSSHRNRLPAYTKITVSSLVAASAVGTTEAAIVYFDVNPDQTLIGNDLPYVTFGNIDLSTGIYSLANGGNFFSIFIASNGNLSSGAYAGTVQWGLSSTDYSGSTPFQPTRVQKLAFGTSISDISPSIGSWVDFGSYMLYSGTGPWVGGGNAYAPLRINAGGGDYNYGWVNINFTDNGGGTSSSIITGFAFEDQINTAILAGDQGGPAAVPEPGTMAVGAGLFALAVGVHLRRRREKKAAASDALLNLASGARGVEKFRADKVA